jgi:EEF1A lysine methyltransferase 1
LQEFYDEREQRQQEFDQLEISSRTLGDRAAITMDAFGEDWNASQFWVF